MSEHTNAFEETDPKIDSLTVETPVLDEHIAKMEAQIKAFEDLGLRRTADINRPKLARLRQEREKLREG